MTNAEIKFLELVPSQLKEIAKQLAKLNENMDKLISQNQAAPNLVKPSDKVVTICYNQREEWNDRQEAIKFFRDAMMNSEGSEHERYFKIWSELESVLGEVSCRRYVAMTCNTADADAAKAYEDFVENIQPIMNEYDDKLNKKLVAHPAKDALKGEFGEWFKSVQVSLDLFSPENIPLETEENKEIQAYQL